VKIFSLTYLYSHETHYVRRHFFQMFLNLVFLLMKMVWVCAKTLNYSSNLLSPFFPLNVVKVGLIVVISKPESNMTLLIINHNNVISWTSIISTFSSSTYDSKCFLFSVITWDAFQNSHLRQKGSRFLDSLEYNFETLQDYSHEFHLTLILLRQKTLKSPFESKGFQSLQTQISTSSWNSRSFPIHVRTAQKYLAICIDTLKLRN
jgi:hypothetical protein